MILDAEYGVNPVEDMMSDYEFKYHINTGELSELFDNEAMYNLVANLDDWD